MLELSINLTMHEIMSEFPGDSPKFEFFERIIAHVRPRQKQLIDKGSAAFNMDIYLNRQILGSKRTEKESPA